MYVNADSVYIEEIPPSVAKKMIIEKHYTHAFSMCRYALGIYYVGEQDHKFYDGKETKLIGCMTYGYPVSPFVIGHNLSHHQHTGKDQDIARTDKLRFRWNFLNQALFFFITS